jgi:group II intron reverse transcriptase/maturase
MVKPQNGETGFPAGDRVEPEGTPGVRSIETPETTDRDRAGRRKSDGELLERMLGTDNLSAACGRVVANRSFENGGAAGVDRVTVEELQPYLTAHYRELCESIRGGWYKPQPLRRVEIPQPDGGVRLLGAPAAIDRIVQQAMVQILQPVFEPAFSESSYGFRLGRSAEQAIQRAIGLLVRRYYEEGYTWVVDLALEKHFDAVNHDLLIKMVRKTVKDEAMIGLIKKFLKNGVMADGIVSLRELGLKSPGAPQGGNLPSLLSNIYLTKFDKMLEERGHKFVRYAGDTNIYLKSQRAAERVMEGCVKFLEGKLKLKVNRKKSTVGNPLELKVPVTVHGY